MRSWHRLTLRPSVAGALTVAVGCALLSRAGAPGRVVFGEGPVQASRERASLPSAHPSDSPLAPDGVPSPAAQPENGGDEGLDADARHASPGGRTAPKGDGSLTDIAKLPENAKRAIAKLEEAGLRVEVSIQVDSGDEEAEDDEQPSPDEARGETSRVRFRVSGAKVDEFGFRAPCTREALGELLRSLPNVDDIDLAGTNVPDEYLELLRETPMLAWLDLRDTPISDKGLAHLGAMRSMESLTLANTQICGDGLAHLRGMTKLSNLSLDRTRITDESLRNLSQLRSLEYLRLTGTSISDAGIGHLRALPLQALWLNGTFVSDAGLVHFREGMSELEYLDLQGTKVTKDGLAQLRGVAHLQGVWRNNATNGGIVLGLRLADNPQSIEAASPEQIIRLEQVLWWLPTDTEAVFVAQGPFSFCAPTQEWLLDNTVSLFEQSVRPHTEINTLRLESRTLDEVPVALLVKASGVAFDACHIIVFERPLAEAGASFMAAVRLRATRTELIGETEVAQIERDVFHGRWTSFIAHPAPDLLIFANNRAVLAEVLTRMAKKFDRRAFDSDLPELKHLDLSARQWAIRHYKHTRGGQGHMVGCVYALQPGDSARVLCLPRDEGALENAKRSWSCAEGNVREMRGDIIEITFPVRERAALDAFFGTLVSNLWPSPTRRVNE